MHLFNDVTPGVLQYQGVGQGGKESCQATLHLEIIQPLLVRFIAGLVEHFKIRAGKIKFLAVTEESLCQPE